MSQQRNSRSLGTAAVAMVLLTVVGAAGYVFLVQREEANALAAAERAEAMEQDVAIASAFVEEHDDLEISPDAIDLVKDRIVDLLPRGRRDVEVVEYLRDAARNLNLRDFQPDIEGGMVVDPSLREDLSGLGPLSTDPTRLRRSALMNIRFTSNYQQLARFLDELGKAPWLFELGIIDISREAPRTGVGRRRTAEPELDLQVRLVGRYVHRCVQEPCEEPRQQGRRRR